MKFNFFAEKRKNGGFGFDKNSIFSQKSEKMVFYDEIIMIMYLYHKNPILTFIIKKIENINISEIHT
jgi:hypothetical protein